MSIKLNIIGKPISINKTYYKDKKVLTRDARIYRNSVHLALVDHLDTILTFNKNHQESPLRLEVIVNVPKKHYYVAKSNRVSRQSGDLDNYLKPLIDFLFNPRYGWTADHFTFDGKPVKSIGIDDQYITEIQASKRPTGGTSWTVDILVSSVP